MERDKNPSLFDAQRQIPIPDGITRRITLEPAASEAVRSLDDSSKLFPYYLPLSKTKEGILDSNLSDILSEIENLACSITDADFCTVHLFNNDLQSRANALIIDTKSYEEELVSFARIASEKFPHELDQKLYEYALASRIENLKNERNLALDRIDEFEQVIKKYSNDVYRFLFGIKCGDSEDLDSISSTFFKVLSFHVNLLREHIHRSFKKIIRIYRRHDKSKHINCSCTALGRVARRTRAMLLHTNELKFNDPSPTRLVTLFNLKFAGGKPQPATNAPYSTFVNRDQSVAVLGV